MRRSKSSTIVLRLLTFGGLDLESDARSTVPRLRPQRLALLAVLAAAGDRGLSRDRLAGFFWSDSDEEHARHSLRQALYALRHDLDREVIRSVATNLTLDGTAITSDVAEFTSFVAIGERERAVALVRGAFLDGFYLAGASAFERWVEDERARLGAATTALLLALAADATRSDQRDAAVEWWRQLTARDPLSGRFALGYLKALAARGDRVEALAHARLHEAMVRRELKTDPDPDVRRLEAELRAMPAPHLAASRNVGDSEQAARAARDDVYAERRPNEQDLLRAPMLRRRALVVGAAAALLLLAVTAAFGRQRGWFGLSSPATTIAVGLIREDGVADSLRIGGVITDMLATNLARIEGVSVLANSRLLELVRPGRDPSAEYADAARRAGASELLEGRLQTTSDGLSLELQRVRLRNGIVQGAYRASAHDRYALVDSMTRTIANNLQLVSPASSVAEATTSSPVAYRLYEEGLRAYYEFDLKGAQRLMQAARQEDSTFAMAAYYEVSLAAVTGAETLFDGRHLTEARKTARRLAQRAPARERLTILAELLADDHEPRALAVAESLTARFPDDPRALMTLGRIRSAGGDWAGAAAATERAIALDSASETPEGANCRLCQDFMQLADLYFWWDSLAATERTARRYLNARPSSHQPQFLLARTAARLGDSASAYAAFRRLLSLGGADRSYKLNLDLALEAYDVVERDVQPLLASSSIVDWENGAWVYLIALRNEGRLRDATLFHRNGSLPGLPPLTAPRSAPDDFNAGLLALERGEPRAAAAVFGRRVQMDMSRWAPGVRSRHLAWNGTLQAMSLAAAGDTFGVRALADSVEVWGSGSAYGRDRKAHHYLRGLVLATAGRCEDAVREFRAAIHSTTLGFTRVNYELARCLLLLRRPQEAAAILQPALRGEIDASNLYITRTDLHELLAQAFDGAGRPDSAAAHYRAVVKAWQRADPAFHVRRERAHRWLTRQVARRPS